MNPLNPHMWKMATTFFDVYFKVRVTEGAENRSAMCIPKSLAMKKILFACIASFLPALVRDGYDWHPHRHWRKARDTPDDFRTRVYTWSNRQRRELFDVSKTCHDGRKRGGGEGRCPGRLKRMLICPALVVVDHIQNNVIITRAELHGNPGHM